jgi:hypothetical protein
MNRFSKLTFIIGTFFTLVSIILVLGHFIDPELASNENLYTGLVFMAFGLGMILLTKKE